MKKLICTATVMLLAASPAAAADLEKGRQAFTSRCSSCHGMTGLGDGPVGKAMPPGVVTNLTNGPFKYATDLEKTKELILKGGGALKLNAMMPAAPSISQDELVDLASYVLSLRGK